MTIGNIRKLHTEYKSPVEYSLPLGDTLIHLNPYIGRKLTLEFTGIIECTNCGVKTKKSYAQGHCFNCMQSKASCDMCIMKPELCHHHQGTCREPEWGLKNCMDKHTVYLANSSGLKVGITHRYREITRWIDQGAVAAIEIAEVPTRLHSGQLEVALKNFVADKTNWRKMLKNDIEDIDLIEARDYIFKKFPPEFDQYKMVDSEVKHIEYPVLEYPTKVTSFNFDKTPIVEGILKGIKGQYLIFEHGVINIRKFTGYKVQIPEA